MSTETAEAHAEPAWPRKTREMHNHHMDSTIWNDLAFREGDIVIATYAKSGTTWMQQIVSQLLFDGPEDLPVAEMSPWLDLRVPPKAVKLPEVEAQTHRRFLKTHLPVDALVFSPEARYVYVGRDGRDVMWSMHNHHLHANAAWYDALNNTPGRVGPPIGPPPEDPVEYFRHWLEANGDPLWPFWENVRSWWAIRALPNVRLVHFADLKRDLEGEMRGIAGFLGIEPDPAAWPRMLEHCSFEWMKRNAAASVPLGGAFWEGGAQRFIHRGTNGRWQGVLPDELSQGYEARAVAELGAEAADWLRAGHGAR
ncbi:sulfotransferase domain-containing protein [Jannaschia sp. W003]|uniref:sulfotransferase domain-containing protein n=1 Tax=Jannaschia sp. W003 TaxID=2867012 RepID=UPI0021A717D0|nr:sulfotransferase domain-containing protein [Jannaschia sp. W003]UWQ20111.1 sulfotransferase domain-containing protein [Jannaschia sp. W003]